MARWFRHRPRGRFLVGSPLRRLEWGTAGRHRRRTRRAVGAAITLAAVGIGVGTWALFFRSSGTPIVVGPRGRVPTCASARLPGRVGELAWAGGGRLQTFDLDTCTRATVVRSGAQPPVRFSSDGAWIAFGSGSVVDRRGGRVRRPMGDLTVWAWSPSGSALAGVTPSGRVLVGGPRGTPAQVFQKGASSVAWAPNGRDLALGAGNLVVLTHLEAGVPSVLYQAPKKDVVQVVGWSPGGNWVLFFQRSSTSASAQLNAVPISGGGYHNVFDPVLPYADFLSWCGGTLAVAGGGDTYPSEGQQVLISAPPDWRTSNLARDFRSSWISPSCSPDGKRIAVTVLPNHVERPPGYGRRSVWVIGAAGQPRRRLAGADGKAYEAPRWSGDGRFVLVVERALKPNSLGSVVLISVDPGTLKAVKTVGAITELGIARNERGHLDWTDKLDWHR